MEKESCLYCHHNKASVQYQLTKHQILRCEECDLMRLFPMPKPQDTRAIYSDLSYFQNTKLLEYADDQIYGYVDYMAERFNRQKNYQPIASLLYDYWKSHNDSTKKPRLLDIGCGLGYFLEVAESTGFDVAGVEYNPEAVRSIRENYSFPVIESDIESLELQQETYDAITMFDVIEHLHNPFTSLQTAHQLLRVGGTLAISTMDSESLISRMIGKRLEDFRRTREHLYFFSKETLNNCLKQFGFKILRVDSYGHTFDLQFLSERMGMINKPLSKAMCAVIKKFKLGQLSVSLDPKTKMIVYATKVASVYS